MNVLHLLVAGDHGGIEVLMRNYAMYAKHNNYFCFVWNGGVIADEMEAKGANVIRLSYLKDGPVYTFRCLLDLLREKDINVVIEHNAAQYLRVVLAVLKILYPKLITVAYTHADATLCCNMANRHGLWLRKAIQKYAIRTTNGVIAISESVKKSLVDLLHVNPDKIKVIYNGALLAKTRRSESAKQIRLVYVGRIVEEKGIQETLQALAAIKKDLDFTFDIIGDGPYREKIEALVDQLGLCDRVNFMGVRRDVPDILAERDIFIHMPSCEEGFGVAIVEAMAAGCVCVCAKKGGIPEVIHDGVDGVLVPTGTSEELVQILRQLIPQYLAGEYTQMQNNAVKQAKEFSIENYSEKLEDYLEELQRA